VLALSTWFVGKHAGTHASVQAGSEHGTQQ